MPRPPLPLLPALAAILAALAVTVGGPIAPARALEVPPARGPGQADWPLHPQPAVISGFDPPASRWGAGHRGVDLLGVPGQAVRAAADGTVSFAGRLAGRGVVVVSNGTTRTTYEPVTAEVRVGERVAAGTQIGRLEVAGSHCLPASCLHWGLRQGELYLDPLTLVGGGPVRLLPWAGTVDSRQSPGHASDGPGSVVAPALIPALPGWRPLGDAVAWRG